MGIAGVLTRTGAMVCAVGLFLLITPYPAIGFLLVFSGLIVACVSWGAARTKTGPGRVAIVGVLLILLGLAWMWLNRAPWECFSPGTCYNWLDIVANPFFLLGLAVAFAGILLVALAVIRSRHARRTRARESHSATPSH